jgi:hypothetical protein
MNGKVWRGKEGMTVEVRTTNARQNMKGRSTDRKRNREQYIADGWERYRNPLKT